jgi:hypothetical protein
MQTFKDAARALFKEHGILPVAVAGKMPLGGTGWNTLGFEDRLLLFGATMCTGVGLQCGFIFHPKYGPVEVRVIDVDIDEVETRNNFVGMLLYLLGDKAPAIVWRWGRRPACVVFTQPGVLTRERYGKIQLLGPGKQAVWWGTHPDTAAPYTHPDGDLMAHCPPFVDAVTLNHALLGACAHAGVAVEGPGTDYDKVAEAPEEQFAALTADDLARYRAEFVAEINKVLPLPEKSGRGTILYGIGNRFGWLARRDPELAKLVDQAISMLPGSEGAGDIRDLKRGLDDSKGLAQSGQANRNIAYRQFVQDWRTGQPRVAVVDELRAGKRAEKRSTILRDLLLRPVEPMTQVVDGLVPSVGLFMIAADPKTGKSWLATDLMLAIAEGSSFVGMPCMQGSAMYIALEETHAEFMDRLGKIRPRGVDTIQDKFRAVFVDDGVPRLEADFKGGLLEFMDDMLFEDPTLRAFTIDTMQHALGDIEAGQAGKNSYKIEYEAISVLHKYALSRKVAIVLLHHTNKSKSEAAAHRISGSTGITAAVGGFVELKVGDENPYSMTVTGRVRGVGIIHQQWAREENVAVWSPLEGTEVATGRSGMKEQVFNVMVAANCELTPADIVRRLKIDERVAAARLGDLRREGRLQQPRRGLYCIAGAAPRREAIIAALLKSNCTVPATNELRMLHDPDGKRSRWADMDAERFGFENDVIEAIEAAGFHDGKDALKHMDVYKLTHTHNGVVWFFGASWRINQTQQALPWALKTPWSV